MPYKLNGWTGCWEHQPDKSYKERYQRLADSEWFKEHYEDKSLGEIIEEE